MQGIIYTSPRQNKLSIGRKQRVKKSLHSSLQNQIRFTAVMVKKWGLSQSSSTSYRELVGHQSSSGQAPHCTGTGDSGSLGSPARDTGTEPSKATQPEPRGSTLEESCKEKLQLLLPMAVV